MNLLKKTKIWRIENYTKFIGTLNLGSFSIWCSDWLRGLSLFLIGRVITLKIIFSEVRSAVMGISPISGVRYDIQYHGWYERYFGAGLNNTNDSFQMSHIIWVILNESLSPRTQKSMCLSWQRKKTMPIENSKNSYVPVRWVWIEFLLSSATCSSAKWPDYFNLTNLSLSNLIHS